MANSTVEKQACENCGADVRENTQFCYNCGSSRENDAGSNDEATADRDHDARADSNGNETGDDTQAALDDLEAKLGGNDTTEDEKLAQAAEQRRKARVVRRQPKQYVWEPADEMSATRILLLSILVAVAAGVVVLITVYWK